MVQSKLMAYASQDFGQSAPPDSGGHLGSQTRPQDLVASTRPPRPRPPFSAGPRSGQAWPRGTRNFAIAFMASLVFTGILMFLA